MVYLYNNLTKPFRFLMFTVDEFLIPLFVMTLFYVIQMSFVGLVLGVGSFVMIRKWNRVFGAGVMQKALYWYANIGTNKGIVSSWKREWL